MNPELLLPVAFLAGLFGSGHCFGMCGPVVVLLETGQQDGARFHGLSRRLIYNLGRLLFYALLGAVAASAGVVLTRAAGIGTGLSILRTLAGILVVAIGLNLLLGWRILRYLEKSGAMLWRAVAPLARHVLPATTPGRALGAGFLWGALPCGLVYSSVAIAATSGNAMSGALVMLAFWSGTLPALLVAGASARTLGSWTRKPLLRRVTGMALVIVGLAALAMPYMHAGQGA